ncbi:MAG: hypothetical protein ACP5TL_02780 [Candidatus Micrarchaeia archaeon]
MGKIVIKSTEMPREDTASAMIKWFCNAFDLDADIEAKLLMKFIEAARKNKAISSSELKISGVARSTIIYHLNRFIDYGLVVRKGRKYIFRGPNMESAIEEIEYDIDRELKKMLAFAKELDKQIEDNHKR